MSVDTKAIPNWVYGPYTILGNLSSKSNSRQIGKKYQDSPTGRKLVPFSRKSDEALQWTVDCLRQIPRPRQSYAGPVSLSVVVYYRDMRPDLDTALLHDALQKSGIIVNDRQIQQVHAWRRVSKKNPRLVFSLTAVPPCEVEP